MRKTSSFIIFAMILACEGYFYWKSIQKYPLLFPESADSVNWMMPNDIFPDPSYKDRLTDVVDYSQLHKVKCIEDMHNSKLGTRPAYIENGQEFPSNGFITEDYNCSDGKNLKVTVWQLGEPT